MSRVQRLTVVLVLNLALAAGLVAVGVGAHAIILLVRGWYWLDPAVALTIAALIAYHAVALIRTLLRGSTPGARRGPMPR